VPQPDVGVVVAAALDALGSALEAELAHLATRDGDLSNLPVWFIESFVPSGLAAALAVSVLVGPLRRTASEWRGPVGHVGAWASLFIVAVTVVGVAASVVTSAVVGPAVADRAGLALFFTVLAAFVAGFLLGLLALVRLFVAIA